MTEDKIPGEIRALIAQAPRAAMTKELLQRSLGVGVPESARESSAALLEWLSTQREPETWVGLARQSGKGNAFSGLHLDFDSHTASIEVEVGVPVYYTRTFKELAFITTTVSCPFRDLLLHPAPDFRQVVADHAVDLIDNYDLDDYLSFDDEDCVHGPEGLETDYEGIYVSEFPCRLTDLANAQVAVGAYLSRPENEEEA